MKTFLAFFLAVLLSGCASNDYAQYTATQQAIAVSKSQADAARYQALATIAATGTDTARVAAVMALAMGGGQATAPPQIAAPAPNAALQWASLLVPAVTQVAGMRYQHLSQQVQSNNATALGISTNQTFAGIAGRIQAPGAVTNTTMTDRNDTTNTLSGTGSLGGGAYSLTDRNDVTSPVVQVVPTVIQPTVIPPVVQVTPTVITPINTPPVVVPPTVITPIVTPPTVIPPVIAAP